MLGGYYLPFKPSLTRCECTFSLAVHVISFAFWNWNIWYRLVCSFFIQNFIKSFLVAETLETIVGLILLFAYSCKHYNLSLGPNNGILEVGKPSIFGHLLLNLIKLVILVVFLFHFFLWILRVLYVGTIAHIWIEFLTHIAIRDLQGGGYVNLWNLFAYFISTWLSTHNIN